jgi:hypothetical protein
MQLELVMDEIYFEESTFGSVVSDEIYSWQQQG